MNRKFEILIAALLAVLLAGFVYSGFQKAAIHREQFPPMINDTSPVMVSQAYRANSQQLSILFIGNSFTHFNNLPKKVVALADADADSPFQLTVQMVARSGSNLTQEYEDIKAPGQVIQSRKWDYVVLQEQSFWAMTPEWVDETTTMMRNFDAMIREDGAQTVIFLTWANQRDSSWYKNPEFSFTHDPEYMQQQLDEKTNVAAQMLHAAVVPAGDYWAKALAARPTLPLFEPDGHHPSPTGAYLNALAFYHHLTGRPVTQIAYLPTGVNAKDADFLRKLVSATAVDAQSQTASQSQVSANDVNQLSASDVQKLADQGNAAAQNYLGWKYGFGQESVKRDYTEAVKWWNKSAEQGDAQAQYYLGEMYKSGSGVAQDFAEAAKWYRKAAEQDYAPAESGLANLYDGGLGVPKDYAEAAEWSRKAALQDDPAGMEKLGILYAWGHGVEKNDDEAFRWFQKAAEKGNAEAQCNLANTYLRGEGNVPQNYPEAFNWYKKAAEQGFALGEFKLANLYMSGQGTPQDFTEAAKWYRKAAEQGHFNPDSVNAMGRLGVLYAKGLGVKQDYEEAVFWLSYGTDTVRYLDKDAADAEFAALDEAEKHLTPEQLSAVSKRAREWRPAGR